MSTGQPGVILPRDISKSVIAAGQVPITTAALFVGENPARSGLLIKNQDAANAINITPATIGAGAPVTQPVAAGVGAFALAAGASLYFGSLPSAGVTTSFGGPCATCGFFGVATAAPVNVTVWEWP
jgi:hypothetical protein